MTSIHHHLHLLLPIPHLLLNVLIKRLTGSQIALRHILTTEMCNKTVPDISQVELLMLSQTTALTGDSTLQVRTAFQKLCT